MVSKATVYERDPEHFWDLLASPRYLLEGRKKMDKRGEEFLPNALVVAENRSVGLTLSRCHECVDGYMAHRDPATCHSYCPASGSRVSFQVHVVVMTIRPPPIPVDSCRSTCCPSEVHGIVGSVRSSGSP